MIKNRWILLSVVLVLISVIAFTGVAIADENIEENISKSDTIQFDPDPSEVNESYSINNDSDHTQNETSSDLSEPRDVASPEVLCTDYSDDDVETTDPSGHDYYMATSSMFDGEICAGTQATAEMDSGYSMATWYDGAPDEVTLSTEVDFSGVSVSFSGTTPSFSSSGSTATAERTIDSDEMEENCGGSSGPDTCSVRHELEGLEASSYVALTGIEVKSTAEYTYGTTTYIVESTSSDSWNWPL